MQTIKDKNCKYITGADENDSDDDDDDDIVGPMDVIRMFDNTELTRDVCEMITKCFTNMPESYALMREAFAEASHLTHVLPKRGMALLLEVMATGSIVVQDTKAFNILQETKAHQIICEEIKVQENKMCAIDLRLEKQKNHMLPNWKHSVFYDSKHGSKIGKVAATIAVYIRFATRRSH